MYKTTIAVAARSGFAAGAKLQRLCHVWQSNHQKTPFSTKKEISGVEAEPARLSRHYAGNRFEIFRRA